MIVIHSENDVNVYYVKPDQIAAMVGSKELVLTKIYLIGGAELAVPARVDEVYKAMKQCKENPTHRIDIHSMSIPPNEPVDLDPFRDLLTNEDD